MKEIDIDIIDMYEYVKLNYEKYHFHDNFYNFLNKKINIKKQRKEKLQKLINTQL